MANTKKPEPIVEETAVEETKKVNTPKKVTIKLPLSRTEKEDVYVGLNGRTYLIKRGEYVEVPYGVAKILERREKMLSIAMEYEAKASAALEELLKK